MERNAFEYLYSTRMERANPKGVNALHEQGVLKGIVDMAYYANIITTEEMSQYYNEIMEVYSIINRLEFLFKNQEVK